VSGPAEGPFPRVRPGPASRLEVQRCANALRAGQFRVELSVVDAIEDAGGVICEFDFETNKRDAISHGLPGMPPMFFVNITAPADRVRFTLRHELGHMVMHQSSVAYVELTNAAQGESQADKFASEFLMPAEDIAFELGSNPSLSRLADLKPRWRVSMAALLKRAGDLARISERRSRLCDPGQQPPRSSLLSGHLFRMRLFRPTLADGYVDDELT